MNRKVLCVDDEPNVLMAYSRGLRKICEVSVAEGGERGLEVLKSEGPFAVVVSDMRMPGLDGIKFLKMVENISPYTVRVMVTGNADQRTAVDAVNEGHIFRFLTKPTSPESLELALTSALEQYRLVTAEKHLIENTLTNSLNVMSEILSMVNPTAFSRSSRIKKVAKWVADKMEVPNAWEIEIAGMLSKIGCVSVPEEILNKLANSIPLAPREAEIYRKYPEVGYTLISRIPRMERVAQIIAQQNRPLIEEPGTDPPDLLIGMRILKAVMDFDRLHHSGRSSRSVLQEMRTRSNWYDLKILEVLDDLVAAEEKDFVRKTLDVHELRPGMIIREAITSLRGPVLLSAGHEITMALMMRIRGFAEAGIIRNEIDVDIPKIHFEDGFELPTDASPDRGQA